VTASSDVERMQVESVAACVAASGGHLRMVVADFDHACAVPELAL
jgi:hypothetical protein